MLAFTHNMVQEHIWAPRIKPQVDVSIPQFIALSPIRAPNTQKSVLLHRRTGHASITICVSADERQDSQGGGG
jgi:hypothetical protein